MNDGGAEGLICNENVRQGDWLKAKDDANFLDLDRPIMSQMWKGNFTKKFYLEQVHIPRHSRNAVRFFESDFLEMFTRTYWFAVPLVWIPIAACIVHDSSTRPDESAHLNFFRVMLKSTFTFSLTSSVCFGILLWTLIEYLMHRFVFHFDKHLPDHPVALFLHFLTHGVHHYLPMDRLRLVMPPALAMVLSVPIVSTIYVIMGSIKDAEPVVGGIFIGYVLYDVSHYYFHNGIPSISHFRWMKRYHLEHHYKDYDEGFGVSSMFWDRVFGTKISN